MEQVNLAYILSAGLSLAVIYLGYLLNRKIEKIKIIESQLSEKKVEAYSKLIAMFYDILKDMKINKNSNPKVMMGRMIECKRDIFSYGSDKVFRAFNKYLVDSTKESSNMGCFLELMLEIRKDIRNDKTILTKRDLIVNIMQDEVSVDELKHLWNIEE